MVLRIANSDHCLCVSNPRCLRISWKVTSNYQRITNQLRIFCGAAPRSPHRRAWVLNSARGSRMRTGHGEQARGVPHGRFRSDLDRALPAPVAVGDLDRLPNGPWILGHLRKIGQPLAFEARPSYLMGASWQSRFIEGSIQAQAADEDDRIGELAAAVEHFERCIGTIGYGHHLTLWVPSPYYQQQQPGPLLGYLLVGFALLGGITLGRSQGRKEGQSPNPPGPGNLHQQHHAYPSESAALHELFTSGTNRVSLDAPGSDLLGPPPLQGLVDAHDQRISLGHKHLHQQPQQNTRLAFRLEQLALLLALGGNDGSTSRGPSPLRAGWN